MQLDNAECDPMFWHLESFSSYLSRIFQNGNSAASVFAGQFARNWQWNWGSFEGSIERMHIVTRDTCIFIYGEQLSLDVRENARLRTIFEIQTYEYVSPTTESRGVLAATALIPI
jgi:hypothetical protein